MQHIVDMPSTPPRRQIPAPPQNAVKGILLMLVALAVFSCLDTTAKYMASVAKLPVTQVVWLRFMSQFFLIVMLVGALQLPRLLITQRPKQQLMRSVLMLFSTLLNFLALKYLRLDQTQTINFLAPFVVALMAGPFLGEWVGWRRMVAIGVGFSGILVVVRPGVAAFEPALILSVGAMLS
ncbi:MAG: DMT family transporter [Hyphomicrobiaceae bacterium]